MKRINKQIIKNKYGQYMTPNNMAKFMFSLSNIDKKFDLIIGNPPYIRWKNLEQELKDELSSNELWNKYCNSLCDYANIFIIKSIELLKDGGELIFITPEYWLNTTHSLKMRNYMIQNGFFEEIYHFNETPIFEKVTVSTIVFKYRKSNKVINTDIKLTKYFSNQKLTDEIFNKLKFRENQENAQYLLIPQFKIDKNWLLAPKEITDELNIFEDKCKKSDKEELVTIGDVCHIGNGMVSGLDKAFQVENIEHLTNEEIKYLIQVTKAKNLSPYFYTGRIRYIFVNESISLDEFKEKCPNYYNHLFSYLEQLNNRYKYNKDIKFWEWVFLRNYNLFSQNSHKIFVPCKEKISNKDYFRFSYVEDGVFPTQDVTAIYKKDGVEESLFYILAFLNSKYVFDWLRFNGIVKGNIVEFSEKPISSIPFKRINFNDEKEVKTYNQIVFLTKSYLKTKKESILKELNEMIDSIFIEKGEVHVCELRGA